MSNSSELLVANIVVEKGVSDKHIKLARTAIHIINGRLSRLQFIPEVSEYHNSFDTLPSGKVNAQMLGRIRPFSNQRKMNMFVTARDMSVPNMNYIFGNSRDNEGNFIVSSARLDLSHNGDPYEFLAVALHEAGHSLGQVNINAPQYDHRSTFPGHCRNDCVMQTVNGLSDVRKVSQLIEKNHDTSSGFCNDCSSDLAKKYIP